MSETTRTTPQSQAEIVEVLEQLLLLARMGELHAFFGAAVTSSGDVIAGVNLVSDVSLEDVQVSIETLHEQLNRSIANRLERQVRLSAGDPELHLSLAS